MKLRLVAVGERLPRWAEDAVAEFAARLPREWRFDLSIVPVAARGRNADVARLRQAEGERMLRACGKASCIAFDERGELLATADWARAAERWQRDGADVALLIGGPDGLAPECLARAQARWSLSRLTLPHALARVVVVEQLYRAASLLANHPYHRA
ncbi:MAG TPA: 23S rRNA (pseudouridine(1915)-N(3))-methyltransferase RlmH [Candidatus Binatia bacterium]|nr:23S rRNA (pseudouridine(1915)-N(3))-methyltransferase RlmH [Candidatus Binatia bacterium]